MAMQTMAPFISPTTLCATLLLLSLTALTTTTGAPVAAASTEDDAQLDVSARPINTRRGCLRQMPLACQLESTRGNRVSGTVTFSPQYWSGRRFGERCGVIVAARVRGLSRGLHGFHIHQFGDIRRNNGKLAGGHFASPSGSSVSHGLPTDRRSHWGDLGNLVAWSGGNAAYRRVDFKLRLSGIVGRGMVIHAKEDKGASFQSSGDAGSRQAHCVIGYANPDLATLR